LKGTGKTGSIGKAIRMILDTSAWIELFQGTKNSGYIAKILREKNCFTSIVTVAETTEWCARKGLQHKMSGYFELIKTGSQLLGLDENICRLAGELNHQMKKAGKKWGMIDSIIAATAQSYNLKILTKDHGFSYLPDAEILS
jgi:predicted nucleic acid-binding protein